MCRTKAENDVTGIVISQSGLVICRNNQSRLAQRAVPTEVNFLLEGQERISTGVSEENQSTVLSLPVQI